MVEVRTPAGSLPAVWIRDDDEDRSIRVTHARHVLNGARERLREPDLSQAETARIARMLGGALGEVLDLLDAD